MEQQLCEAFGDALMWGLLDLFRNTITEAPTTLRENIDDQNA